MTLQQNYDLVALRVYYVELRLWEYTSIERQDQRAYFIGQMHQHLMEAKQLISEYQKK